MAILLAVANAFLSAQTISGFVREEATGEPLFYVNVFVKDTYVGGTTNQDGYYVIPHVSPGDYEVSASIIGYELKTVDVHLEEEQDLRLDFRLKSSVLVGEEVYVTAERQKFEKLIEPSRVTLSTRQIEMVPSLVEPDVFRTLQLLPGVQTINDFSSALYVRGSTPDQNLILLDGITVYNPFHLGGVFSTFNTDAIKEADFQAGGFPARYGGRMGSILNIINREGNTERFHAKANISLISSKGLIEGPIPRWAKIKGSWMLSGRRTYFDKIAQLITYGIKKSNPDEAEYLPKNLFPYYFYDIEGKMNLDVHDNHRLILSTFYGDDVFSLDFVDDYSYEDPYYNEEYESRDEGLFDWRWGNRTNSLTWRWIISPKLIAKTFLAESRFRFWVDFDSKSTGQEIFGTDTTRWQDEYHFDTFDIIQDKTIETELTFLTGRGHTLSGGFQHKQLEFTLGMVFEMGYMDEPDTFTVLSDTALWMADQTYEQGIFIQDKWQISPGLSAQLGLRLSRYSYHNDLYPDPRIGLKYFLTDNTSVKLNWGRYHQFLTTANPPDENFRFIDIWLGVPADRKAPWADHKILGIEHITKNNILLRLETYYKEFANLITLKQGQMFQEAEGEIKFDPFNEFYDMDAYAYGLEFLAQRTTGNLKGWIGYTLAHTKWKTQIHDWYFPKYDRTHTLNIVGDWQWTEKTHVSMTLSYSTGNPFTPIQGRIGKWGEDLYGQRTYWWNESQYLVGKKNSARYPLYFRWDVGFVRSKPLRNGGSREWYLQVINVTNHLNTLMYIYEEKWNEKEQRNEGVQRFGIPMFPFFPTFGFRIEF